MRRKKVRNYKTEIPVSMVLPLIDGESSEAVGDRMKSEMVKAKRKTTRIGAPRCPCRDYGNVYACWKKR
jgi:hypothetical protein